MRKPQGEQCLRNESNRVPSAARRGPVTEPGQSQKSSKHVSSAAPVIAALAEARIQSLICLLPERASRDAMHEIQLHNTLSGKIEPFVPLKPGQVAKE